MRKLLFLLILAPFMAQAQQADVRPLAYSHVLYAKDSTMPAAEIYSRCLAWFAKNYGSGKAVIDVQDREAGVIIAKPAVTSSWRGPGRSDIPLTVHYTLSVAVKTGRIKVDCANYGWANNANPNSWAAVDTNPKTQQTGSYSKYAQRALDAVNAAIEVDHQNILAGLQAAINDPAQEW